MNEKMTKLVELTRLLLYPDLPSLAATETFEKTIIVPSKIVDFLRTSRRERWVCACNDSVRTQGPIWPDAREGFAAFGICIAVAVKQ